jgi:hypothetical protein
LVYNRVAVGTESCPGCVVAIGVEVADLVPEVFVDVAKKASSVAMIGPWKLLLPS